MDNKTKTKLIILAALVAVIVAIMTAFGSAFVQALECNGTLSHPNPVVLGETFNVNFFNAMPGWTGTALLNWAPAGLVNLTANPTSTTPFTTSTWTMNSTVPGSYNISVFVVNSATGENCTKNSSILIVAGGRPFLLMDIQFPQTPSRDYTAKSNVNFSVNVSNVGNETATGVVTYFLGQSVEPPSINLGNIPNGTSSIKGYVLTPLFCGSNILEGKTQYNNYYYAEDNETFDVKGSDLVIESFTLNDNNVKVGENVRFNVTVTNINRATSINATNVVVRIYRGSSVLASINLGNISVGETKSGSVTWKAANAGTNILLVASVDSDNECANWNNNNASQYITITGSSGGGGPGGGNGGGYEPICGNGICEWGETYNNCPQDCKIQQNQTNQSQQQPGQQKECGAIEEDIIEISDDGLASLKLYKGTEIKLNGNCIEPREVISLRAAGIPYPIQNFYLVRGYTFLPDGLTFDKEAEITIKYHKGEISDSAEAFIMTYSASEGKWSVLPSIHNREMQEVTAKTSHFSSFALVSTEKPPFTGFIIWNNFVTWASNNWWVILIVVVVIVAAAIIAHLKKK